MDYYIKTFGCQMNFSDSERMASFLEAAKSSSIPLNPPLKKGESENSATADRTPLEKAKNKRQFPFSKGHLLPSPFSKGGRKTQSVFQGDFQGDFQEDFQKDFTSVDNINDADLIIFNTCGVRESAENRVFGQIHNLKKQANKNSKEIKIILTGCLAHRQDVQKKLKDKVDLFCGIKDFPTAISTFLNDIFTDNCYDNYLSITPKYQNNRTAFVPIMTGCNNFCSYCVVPYARGREWSRPITEIIAEINNLNDRNYEEITLLGQNVNSYNSEQSDKTKKIFTNFPALLDILAKQFPKITFKFLTSHPKDFSDELIAVIKKHGNIPNEIHLPIQSGSSKVLQDMNRPYTQTDYLMLIKKIKQEIPGIKITTDIIIGFPTETETEFQETVKVFKKINFSDAYLNKYSPRFGTVAFKLGDPIPWEVKKGREKILRKILNETNNRQ